MSSAQELFRAGEYASCADQLDAESELCVTQFNRALCKHVQQGASQFSLQTYYLPQIESMKIDSNDWRQIVIYCAHSSYAALCAGFYRRAYKRAIGGLKLVDVAQKIKYDLKPLSVVVDLLLAVRSAVSSALNKALSSEQYSNDINPRLAHISLGSSTGFDAKVATFQLDQLLTKCQLENISMPFLSKVAVHLCRARISQCLQSDYMEHMREARNMIDKYNDVEKAPIALLVYYMTSCTLHMHQAPAFALHMANKANNLMNILNNSIASENEADAETGLSTTMGSSIIGSLRGLFYTNTYNRAIAALLSGNFILAKELFSSLVTQAPHNGLVWLRLAQCCIMNYHQKQSTFTGKSKESAYAATLQSVYAFESLGQYGIDDVEDTVERGQDDDVSESQAKRQRRQSTPECNIHETDDKRTLQFAHLCATTACTLLNKQIREHGRSTEPKIVSPICRQTMEQLRCASMCAYLNSAYICLMRGDYNNAIRQCDHIINNGQMANAPLSYISHAKQYKAIALAHLCKYEAALNLFNSIKLHNSNFDDRIHITPANTDADNFMTFDEAALKLSSESTPVDTHSALAHNIALTHVLSDKWQPAYERSQQLMSSNKLICMETALLHILCADSLNDSAMMAEIARDALVKTRNTDDAVMCDESVFVMET